jgi:ATP-dependent RNA circularization protein (DNA/RNA ligase family)
MLEEYSLKEFEYLKNNQWDFSEKIDGTNIRVLWDYSTKNVEIAGKTEKAQLPIFLVERLKEIFTIEILQKLFGEVSVLFFGEGYGKKIQEPFGSLYKKDGVDFILFDILIGNWWLHRENVDEIAKRLNINFVPIIKKGTIEEAIKIVSQGFNSSFGDFRSEGLVLRPSIELFARNRLRIITKIKYRDFLEN